ncbi:peptidyl-prolyl cis-trans isomerase FKBP8 [Prorops nasuta]|uniref:peptidyl-prolyl cis-trans isomerase FKBP8 n=1 Tax=Prorops nasuta TaxID=863751 RepID=UPI0034CE1F8F
MESVSIEPGESQADFIRNELNFDVDPEDSMTKAALSDHHKDECIDLLGNGQLKKTVLKKGENGTRPSRGDICTLKLTGKLENGTIVEEKEKLVIQLGDVEVIQGLDLAIALMDIGEIAKVEVASRFAYGSLGNKPNIPSDANIIYTVELKNVEPETDIETLSVSQRKEIGNKKRENGNWWFNRDEAALAIQCYRRALEFLQPSNTNSSDNLVDEIVTDAELQALLIDRINVSNNLAAAQMKIEAYDAALKSIESVLTHQPTNVKALFRKGKILHRKGEHTLAYTTLLYASKLDPKTKAIQQELAILKEKNAKDAQHEKDLYRKMLGAPKAKNIASNNVRKDNTKKNKNNLIWTLVGGVTAAALGALVYKFSS